MYIHTVINMAFCAPKLPSFIIVIIAVIKTTHLTMSIVHDVIHVHGISRPSISTKLKAALVLVA